VPLFEKKTPIGVLVVQTLRRRKFSQDETRLLTTISAQVSSIIVQARLADSLKTKEQERKEYQKRMVQAMRKLRSYESRREKPSKTQSGWRGRLMGLAASPGFGRAAHIARAAHGASAIAKTSKIPNARWSDSERLWAWREHIAVVKNHMSSLIQRRGRDLRRLPSHS
jgi:phosphotransferase system enzyme I (PtsP)